MNLGTAITLLVVGVVVFFALRSVLRDFRNGSSKCAECGKPCGKAKGTTCKVSQNMVRNLEKL